MEAPNQTVKIAIVDDHQLFRQGLVSLLQHFTDTYEVLFEAANGNELQQKLNPAKLPDIILLDINMPFMDGFEVVEWVNQHYPALSLLVISMIEKEESIVRMLKMGVKGYLTKNTSPDELHRAISTILRQNYYYTDFITGRLIHSLKDHKNGVHANGHIPTLNEREKVFLQFACSELTYQQIADKMCLSHKTVDGYRNALFEKFDVKSRTGLAIYAIKNELVNF